MIGRLLRPRFLRPHSGPFLYPGEEIRPKRRRGRGGPHVLLEGAAKRAVETGRIRMLVTGGLFALAFSAIGVRLFDLMVLKHLDTTAEARTTATAFHTQRADIVDRNGVLLATNLPTVNLYADSIKVPNPQEAADKLLSVLPHLDRADVVAKLSSGKRFVYLERNLTPRLQAAVNAEGIPGIYFEKSERRAYLHGPLVSHVLGATDPDNNGIAGVERTFDKELKENTVPLQLSIDLRVQYAMRDTLLNAMGEFKAKAAAGLVMDARTGEIVSMVSLPDYDPEKFGDADDDARFNRATLGVYEMGSTFKLFNTAMALESGRIHLNDSYDTVKPVRIARFTIRDSHPEDRWLNVAEILVHSSNIGSARMAQQLGTEAQRTFLGQLGLLTPARLELPEVGAPLYPQPWREINTMTISFGHGIAVTSVQLASAVAAVVNGGDLYPPTLLAGGPAGDAKTVLSPETSAAMRRLMRMVVTDGTAKKADAPGYMVGGKTGTAEKVSASGGYDTDSLRTTFAAAFPMDDPRYVVLTVLDEPKGLKSTYGFATAGWNAAPTAGKLISAIGPLLGVQPRFDAPAGRGQTASVAGLMEEGTDAAR